MPFTEAFHLLLKKYDLTKNEGKFSVPVSSTLVRPKEDLLSPFDVCKQRDHKLPVF